MRLAWILLPIIYALILILAWLVPNPGFRQNAAVMLTLMFILVLVLYLVGSSVIKKEISPLKKGAIIGLLIGIISFLGALPWYSLCYARWCGFMQTFSLFGWMNLPFAHAWAPLRMLYNFYIAFIYPVVFILFGTLFGYIYKRNTKTFWTILIIALVAYILLGIFALLRMMGGIG